LSEHKDFVRRPDVENDEAAIVIFPSRTKLVNIALGSALFVAADVKTRFGR
jgi:hypothetical protein